MVINFKEIPQANSSEGLQDTFELFTRDFLECIGYEVTENPSRGSDGKKDLMVKELREGIGGKTEVRWLVSCKHYAHSGKSVNDLDESDIVDRVRKHNCDGFMGVYSTIPSTSLASKLQGLKGKIDCLVYDREKIEGKLLDSNTGRDLCKRYFPKSIRKYVQNNPRPVKFYKNIPKILCEYCGKDLLKAGEGIWAGLQSRSKALGQGEKTQIHSAYFSCKGKCDFILKAYYKKKRYDNCGWFDVGDFINPVGFLNQTIDYIRMLNSFELHEEANEKTISLLKASFPHIMRELTDDEKSSNARYFFEEE